MKTHVYIKNGEGYATYPIEVGQRALIFIGQEAIHTSPVSQIRRSDPNKLVFETIDTVYLIANAC